MAGGPFASEKALGYSIRSEEGLPCEREGNARRVEGLQPPQSQHPLTSGCELRGHHPGSTRLQVAGERHPAADTFHFI